MVYLGMALFCALQATDAGHSRESGSGAIWIAPELVHPVMAVQTCGQASGPRARDLVFETLQPHAAELALPQLLAAPSREVVDFEWDPATGELRYSATAPTTLFSDLAIPAAAADFPNPSCGSH